MFSPKSVGVGLSPKVRLIERGAGVFDVAWPDVFLVAVDGVFVCVAGPHKSLRVEDDRFELIHGLL